MFWEFVRAALATPGRISSFQREAGITGGQGSLARAGEKMGKNLGNSEGRGGSAPKSHWDPPAPGKGLGRREGSREGLSGIAVSLSLLPAALARGEGWERDWKGGKGTEIQSQGGREGISVFPLLPTIQSNKIHLFSQAEPVCPLTAASRTFLAFLPISEVFSVLFLPHSSPRSCLAPVPTSTKIFLVMIWFQILLGKNIPAERIHLRYQSLSKPVKKQINSLVHRFFFFFPSCQLHHLAYLRPLLIYPWYKQTHRV